MPRQYYINNTYVFNVYNETQIPNVIHNMTKTVNITKRCLRSNLGGERSHQNHLDHFSVAAVLIFHFQPTYLQHFGIYKTNSRRPPIKTSELQMSSKMAGKLEN